MKDVQRSGYLWGKDDGETGKPSGVCRKRLFHRGSIFRPHFDPLQAWPFTRSQRLHDISHATRGQRAAATRGSPRSRSSAAAPAIGSRLGHLNHAEQRAREPRQRDSAERADNDARGGYHRALAEDAGQQLTRLGSDGEADAELARCGRSPKTPARRRRRRSRSSAPRARSRRRRARSVDRVRAPRRARPPGLPRRSIGCSADFSRMMRVIVRHQRVRIFHARVHEQPPGRRLARGL